MAGFDSALDDIGTSIGSNQLAGIFIVGVGPLQSFVERTNPTRHGFWWSDGWLKRYSPDKPSRLVACKDVAG